jgi:hypothetical protein
MALSFCDNTTEAVIMTITVIIVRIFNFVVLIIVVLFTLLSSFTVDLRVLCTYSNNGHQ